MKHENVCAFTGHRPSHFHFKYDESHPDCVKLKENMRTEILTMIEKDITTYLSGMALGVDIWGAEIVLELKTRFPQLKLIAVLPCETQANNWTVQLRERYFNILSRCDDVIYISRRYTSRCMFKRNQYLVDHAAHIMAVYDDGGRGGTAFTVTYAKKKDRAITLIPVNNCQPVINFAEVGITE